MSFFIINTETISVAAEKGRQCNQYHAFHELKHLAGFIFNPPRIKTDGLKLPKNYCFEVSCVHVFNDASLELRRHAQPSVKPFLRG